MTNEEVRYQSIDYEFPKKLYYCAVLFDNKHEQQVLYFPTKALWKEKDIIFYAKEHIDYYKAMNEKAIASEGLIIIPLYFSHHYPLKKEYWQEVFLEMDLIERMDLLGKAVSNEQDFQLLVTPSNYTEIKNIAELRVAFAFKKGEEETVDQFLSVTKFEVIPEAKNTAIYNIGEYYLYDLVNNKKIRSQRSLKS